MSSYFTKGSNNNNYFRKIAGGAVRGVKAVAGVLDSPITSGVVSLINPELGLALEGVRKTGLLEKIK